MLLKSGWYLEGLIDYEYQYYRLKAYQKMVEREFFQLKLYPHMENTKSLMKESSMMLDNIKTLSSKSSDLEIFLHDILHDSIEVFSDLLIEGQNVFDSIYRNISFFCIDLKKNYMDEVIVISTIKDLPHIFVEKYYNSNIFDSEERSFIIKMQTIYSENFESSISELLVEYIKDKLVKRDKELVTMNFIWANCAISAPYFESVREIIKRKIHNFLVNF